MKNRIRDIGCALRGLAGFHFSDELLLARRDREIGSMARWCMDLHASRCRVCQDKTAHIEDALRSFETVRGVVGASAPLNVPKSLAMLRQRIQNWEAANPAVSRTRKSQADPNVSIRSHIERELRYYLGRPAASALVSRAENRTGAGRGLLRDAESALTDFLGPRAAAAITRKILYSQMLHKHTAHSAHPA